jgi:hypothetical protein
MKKIFIIAFLYIISIGNAIAQTDPNFEFKNQVRNEIGGVKKIIKFDKEDIKKTAYLRFAHQDYKKAYINESKEIYFLRYNMFTDEMEYINYDKTFTLNKNKNKIIDFFEIKAKYGVFKLKDKLNYFVIKYSGKSSVLVKQYVEFDEGKKAITPFDVKVAPKFFRKKDKNFIAFENTTVKIVPKKKKSFYALFADKGGKIKKYTRLQKLSHKKTDDLVQIINYYNSLK